MDAKTKVAAAGALVVNYLAGIAVEIDGSIRAATAQGATKVAEINIGSPELWAGVAIITIGSFAVFTALLISGVRDAKKSAENPESGLVRKNFSESVNHVADRFRQALPERAAQALHIRRK